VIVGDPKLFRLAIARAQIRPQQFLGPLQSGRAPCFLVKLVVSFLLGRRFLGQTAGISIELDHPEVICLHDTRLCSSPIALEAIVADCMTGQWSTSPLLGPVALSDTFGAAVTTVDSARCETTVRLTPGWWLADRTIEGEVLRDLLTEAFGHLAHIERRNESLEIELRANTNAVLAIDRSVCSFCGLPPDSDRPLVVGVMTPNVLPQTSPESQQATA
jgi:hypothetical protein